MFLAQLLDRTLEGRTAIAPRRATRFEPEAGVAGPGWLETEAEAPATAPPRVGEPGPIAPPTLAPTTRFAPPEPPQVVRALIDRAPEPVATPGRTMAEPMPAPAVTIIQQLERLAPAEPAPSASWSPAAETPPLADDGASVREIHTHERVEVRREPGEIERRLETLTREHVIERIAREVAAAPTAAAPPRDAAPTPQFAAEPMRPRRPETAPPSGPLIGRRDVVPPALAAAPAPPIQTTVQVTIGRVEVRSTPGAAPRPGPRQREPRLGLEDYLRRREQG